MYEAERGLFELGRGRALCVTASGAPGPEEASNGGPPVQSEGPDRTAVVASVEAVTPETLALLRRLAPGRLRLVVTRHRARAMGLAEAAEGSRRTGPRPLGAARSGFAPGLSLGLDGEVTPEELVRLSGARMDGGLRAPGDVREAGRTEAAALTLVRLGRHLPAIVSAPIPGARPAELSEALERDAVLRVAARHIRTLAGGSGTSVTPVSEAPVPLAEDEDARFVLFREARGLRESVAILLGEGNGWPDPVPVRLHSACLTGDLFGSLRCDCGEQLRTSLRILADRGGVLLYLAQEGRSIGLGNKFRAYALQQEGLDTVEADRVLGFGPDERRYDAAVGILRYLGIERVQLLTNNPEKVRALENGGIRVADRRPLHGTLNRHNLPYVLAKARRAGHWLTGMLASGVDGGRTPAG